MINEKNSGMKTNETPTSCIVHLADSTNIKDVTSINLCSDLTCSCFESPNDTIHVTFLCHSAKADFYPFVLRTPGLKDMAQNESVNQIAYLYA